MKSGGENENKNGLIYNAQGILYPEIIDKNGYIFFAIHDNSVVGTMALIPRENGVYELNKMAVNKELRGNGIGNQLINFIIDFAKNKKYNFERRYSILF